MVDWYDIPEPKFQKGDRVKWHEYEGIVLRVGRRIGTQGMVWVRWTHFEGEEIAGMGTILNEKQLELIVR